MYPLLGVAACGAKEHGCASENGVVALIMVVALGALIVGAVIAWAGFEWDRGPYAWWLHRRERGSGAR